MKKRLEKDDVRISITGRAKTGKSVIGRVIYDALQNHGLNVELLDQHDHPDGLKTEYVDGCLKRLKNRQTQVQIDFIRESVCCDARQQA